jgi:predicted regulator of Ras-like GTPase activity (Roadblock/LC7/MglB family)
VKATIFAEILQRAVENAPGAFGAIFAAWDGEAVDSYTLATRKDEMLLLAAHYGIILNHVQAALHLSHFGEAEEVILQHQKLDLIVRAVDRRYYVVLALGAGGHLATALRAVLAAASALRKEMY